MQTQTPVINVIGLAKEYVIGRTRQPQGTFYELLSDALTAPFAKRRGSSRPDQTEKFWALKGVSFELHAGEVLGIVGHNGAGKSTLLKVLSRITAPTTGRATVRGKLASLLEVGTGFHSELSGRENIYLNGAILGMTRSEVARKFDEIVDFAEVDDFIDTPVKRYSSGMYVRLAFAVAAHLDPDILIIDEVLSVGDAAFQKKCLGRINASASGGRTVLFVSHNIQAVQSLSTKCLMMRHGEVAAFGTPDDVIAQYLNSASVDTAMTWQDDRGLGNAAVRLMRFAVRSARPDTSDGIFPSNSDIVVEMKVQLDRPMTGLCVGFDLIDKQGSIVLRSFNTDLHPDRMPALTTGSNLLRCVIPHGLLNGGTYQLAPRLAIHNQEWIANAGALLNFSILLNHGESPFWNSLDERSRPGYVTPILNWYAGGDSRSERAGKCFAGESAGI
jgi:lipopolysaccharide transport system ATP-binding protein